VAWKQHVEHDRVVLRRERELQAHRPVLGHVDAEALLLQALAKHRRELAVVLDDEDPHANPPLIFARER